MTLHCFICVKCLGFQYCKSVFSIWWIEAKGSAFSKVHVKIDGGIDIYNCIRPMTTKSDNQVRQDHVTLKSWYNFLSARAINERNNQLRQIDCLP